MAAARWVDAHTPTLSVVDPRGMAVRNVTYCCHPSSPSLDTRITRNHFDPAGRLFASWDPRLWEMSSGPNLENTFDLQGRPVLVDSVDGGWQLSLRDQADSIRSFWDGRGSQRYTEFDELQRPVVVTEWMVEEWPRVSERFTYGVASAEFSAHNQCGQLIRHDHTAGSRTLREYGVGGLLLLEQTRFMRDLELACWSAEFADTRLEDEVFETTQQYGPAGEMLGQTDAMENVRSFAYDQAGQLRETRLTLSGSLEVPQLLVSDIHYDAFGRSFSELAGNGVTTIARYAAENGRLLRLQSCDAGGTSLQDFHYGYDPVGNIIRIEDQAQLTRYFKNQRINPVACYDYDSLYQLIKATGREVSQPSHGPALPDWQTTPLDPNQLRNYIQTFKYDTAGNLQTRHHSGAETFEMFTALDSNRSVAEKGNLVGGFDANGNQLELLRGQRMSWDVRNQLSCVTLVKREDGSDDTECYGYDSPGHRLRKVRLTLSARRTLRSETRYLPGLEIHRDTATGEERHVVSVEVGRSQVRALHWVTKRPRDVRNDQLRFCLGNHLNSSTLELNEQGGVLSREVYYAFGGTALWAGASEIEARYKSIRYSGKERDVTGLYYYGYRYYAPWLQRWVSTDPLGRVNGLNIYCFVGGQPISNSDVDGRYYEWRDDAVEQQVLVKGERILGRGLNEFSSVERTSVQGALERNIRRFDDAGTMLDEYRQESELIMRDFLGPEYESVLDDVVEGWSSTKEMMIGYKGDFGQSRFVKIGAPVGSEDMAHIYVGDSAGRVFLNENFIVNGVNLDINLAHEFSHFDEVAGMVGQGAATLDFWGLPLLLDNNVSLAPQVRRYTLDEVSEFSRRVMRGDAPDYFGASFVGDSKFFTQALKESSDASIVDFDSALREFHSSAEIRASLAANNADSSAYLAYSLHTEYRRRLRH